MFKEDTWVSLRAAALLKKLGFDEECYGRYELLDGGGWRFWECFQPVAYDDIIDGYTAPQVWLAEWWLMQYHGVEVDYGLGMEGLEKTLESLLEQKGQ